MAIITIVDDDYFSGREFAKTVASKLKFEFVDGKTLVDRVAAWGSDREGLRRASEQPPRFLYHLLGTQPVHELELQAALAKDIEGGNVVCYGTAVDLLNLRSSEILRVRVKSSLESRLRLAQDQMHLTSEDAKKHIEMGERRREQWRTYLHESKSTVPHGPGLLINLDQENVDRACDTIRDMIECRASFQPTNQDAALTRKWVLRTAIRAAIAQCPETRNVDLDVAVEGDAVVLSLIPPASDGGTFPVRLAPSMGRAIEAALAEHPGTRYLHPRITVQGDSVVLRGIVHAANEKDILNTVPVSVEASSSLSPASVPDAGLELSVGRRWAEILWSRLVFFKGRRFPIRYAATTTVIGAAVIAALVYGGHSGRKASPPPTEATLHSFLGVITDSVCGSLQNRSSLNANCVRLCVQSKGAKYALREDGHAVIISNQKAAENFAARRVIVTGALDMKSGELHIATIQLAAR